MADVADLRVKYSADTSDFDRGADRVDKGIKGFIKNAGAFAAGDLLAGGIRAIGGAAIGAGGALAGLAMDAADLDSKISGIVALAGGGAEDFDQLAAAIDSLAINPQLIVDSTEAATVMQNLIANGLTLQDVYGGAAEATVLLANATGGSFETAATVATDTMAIFGIEAENMMAAVDGISKVSNASKFDIEDYAYALSQGGAQAASAGVEFADFNAVLVASASNFSGGSDAGTGIRNMFQKLIPTTVDAASAMYQAGLMSTDWASASERLGDMLGSEVAPNQAAVVDAFNQWASNSGIKGPKKVMDAWVSFRDDFEDSAFFDADGNLESAAKIAGAFNTAFDGMTELEKSTALNEMFGPDAARAVLAMADYTEEGFRAMQEGMEGTAGALENARTRTNNLKGDMDVFGGTLDAIKLKIGKEFQPALRTLFQSGTGLLTDLEPAITGMADMLANGLERATPGIVNAIEGIVGSANILLNDGFGALFANLFPDTNDFLLDFSDIFTNLKSSFDTGGLKGLFDEAFANVDIRTALDGLRTKLSAAFANFDLMGSIGTLKGNANGLRDSLMSSLTETISGINWSSASISFSGMVDAVGKKVSAIDWSTVSLVDVGLKLVGVLAPGLGLAIKTAQWVISSDSFSGLVTSVKTALTNVSWGDLVASFTTLGEAITTAIGKIDTSGFSTIFDAFTGTSTNIDSTAAALGRLNAELDSSGESSTYFTRLSESLRQLDESASKVDVSFLKQFDFGAIDKQFNDFTGADAYFKKIGSYFASAEGWSFGTIDKQFNDFVAGIPAKFAGLKGSLGLFDFGAIDKSFNEFVASIPTKLAGIPDLLGFGETTPAWLTSLQGWTWPPLTDLLAWVWPAYTLWTWTAYPSWTWTAYNPWTWTAYNAWTWPSIPRPAWLDAMLSWNPAAAISAATSNATSAITNAFGFGNGDTRTPGSIAQSGSNTSNNGGGYVPTGAPLGKGLGLPALAGSGGGITININGYNQDEESLARRIAAIIQRRG